MSLIKIDLDSTNFTLWEVSFTVNKSYKREEFSFDDGYENFESICDGIAPDQEDEDFEEDDDWYFSAEFSYYACDSGHGDNIITDCLTAMSDDGIKSENFDEIEHSWRKLDLVHDAEYIPMALSTYGNDDIKVENGKLIGVCLYEFVDDCTCSSCT